MLDKAKIDAMRDMLKNGGVRAVSAPTLFPTPPEVARTMAEMAHLSPDHRVLEPSAGTGRLLDALIGAGVPAGQIVAVEFNMALVDGLRSKYPEVRVFSQDFLTMEPLRPFDRILMNPPFDHGVDIRHIRRAYDWLAPGGRLVALCAAGPRQREAFADAWHADLPDDTFKEAGTTVRTGLVVLDK